MHLNNGRVVKHNRTVYTVYNVRIAYIPSSSSSHADRRGICLGRALCHEVTLHNNNNNNRQCHNDDVVRPQQRHVTVRRNGPGSAVVLVPVARSAADVAAATATRQPRDRRWRRGRLLQRRIGCAPAPHRQHVSPRERRHVHGRGGRRRWLDHRRQPSPGVRGRAPQVPLPGQGGRRTARKAARARRQAAPVAGRAVRPGAGSRVLAVRSASGRAPVAAPRLCRRPAAPAIVRRGGVQVVLETAVVRDQNVSGRVHASVAATAAAGDRGKQRGAVGRGARAKVRFQHDRGQGRRRHHPGRLLRVHDDRFQRLSKRSHGHVG